MKPTPVHEFKCRRYIQMSKQISILSVFIFLISCANDSTQDTPVDSQSVWDSIQAPLKVDSPLAKIDSSALDTTAPVINTFKAKFKAWYTTSYCGGAKPTEEIVQQHAALRLLTNSNLKLKNHFTGMVFTCSTNASGEAEVALEEGKYDVYLTPNINSSLNTGFDAKCNLWLDKSLFTVKVSNNGKVQDITIHFECNPCDVNMKKRP